MATQQTTIAGRLLVAPSVILLFLWMIVPLAMTLYFSTPALQPARPRKHETSSACRTICISSPIPTSLARS